MAQYVIAELLSKVLPDKHSASIVAQLYSQPPPWYIAFQMTNADSDFRYMGVNDMMNELNKQNFSCEVIS
jgi:hypothetical protein